MKPLLAGLLLLDLISFLGIDRTTAQCPGSQGNARLSISGIPQIGGTVRIALAGRPLRPFLLAADRSRGPIVIPGIGTICLGPNLSVLVDGFTHPFLLLPPSGTFQMDLTLPNDPSLVGVTYYFQGAISDDQAPNKILALSNSAAMTIQKQLQVQTIFFDDFEAGKGWYADNGLWQRGKPTVGPPAPYSGSACAGTLLQANYPPSADSRWISPPISLPPVAAGEEIRLDFRQWHSMNSGDWGAVEVSTDLQKWTAATCWGAGGWNGVWSQCSVDLSSHAGQRVWIAFRFRSDWFSTVGPGWYLDDVHVFKGKPLFPTFEDFEGGMDLWYGADNGLWEVGVPKVGPASAHSGKNCLGTVLAGNYPPNKGSRFVLKPLRVPTGKITQLSFYHWFSFNSGDTGVVQVSTDNGCTWTDAIPRRFAGSSTGWTRTAVNLTPHAGKRILIGFLVSADWFSTVSTGWYVDDVALQIF